MGLRQYAVFQINILLQATCILYWCNRILQAKPTWTYIYGNAHIYPDIFRKRSLLHFWNILNILKITKNIEKIVRTIKSSKPQHFLSLKQTFPFKGANLKNPSPVYYRLSNANPAKSRASSSIMKPSTQTTFHLCKLKKKKSWKQTTPIESYFIWERSAMLRRDQLRTADTGSVPVYPREDTNIGCRLRKKWKKKYKQIEETGDRA